MEVLDDVHLYITYLVAPSKMGQAQWRLRGDGPCGLKKGLCNLTKKYVFLLNTRVILYMSSVTGFVVH